MPEQIDIVVNQDQDGKFTADRPQLSGSPKVGRGRTWREAVGDLFIQAQHDFNVRVVVKSKDGKPFRFRSKHRR